MTPVITDRVRIGGLMRCCPETVGDLYSNGRAAVAQPEHRMRFRDGAWEWDHE